MTHHGARLVTAALMLVALTSGGSKAQEARGTERRPAPEYEVKAAFLLNFTRFVQWPPAARAADRPFTICILGDDPFGASIDQAVEGERVEGRRIVVERVSAHAGNSCEVLFVSKSVKAPGTVLAAAGPGVLTVGDNDACFHEGAVIAFAVENRRVRFDVNLRAAVRASLQISSRLLSVARRVEQ